MAAIVRVPLSNVVMGSDYTCTITVGAAATPVTVLVDTGSSTLAIDGQWFDPAKAAARTTELAQAIEYGAGRWTGAVVQAAVGLGDVTLPDACLAVTYGETAAVFGGAQGILGLAYTPLDAAYRLPGDTWAGRYPPEQVLAGALIDLPPYFTQLEQAGLVPDAFALAIRRASVCLATDAPAGDPQNHGVLVLGDVAAATELYQGERTTLAVVHDLWYGVNLTAIAVGDQPAIAVAPVAASDPLGSNAIVDSGTNALVFAQPVFDAVRASFAAIAPALAAALDTHAVGAPSGLANADLDLTRWPPLHLTFEAPDGGVATVTIPPAAYWQRDAGRRGEALAYLQGDGGSQGGRSILGLPLLIDRYVIFDRGAAAGRGLIHLAAAR